LHQFFILFLFYIFFNYRLNSGFEPLNDTIINFQLSPSNLCEGDSKFVFVYVFSYVNDFDRRRIIRETWGSDQNIRVGFVLGKISDSSIQELVRSEQNQYDDIIQGNFIDSYRNLSYKSILVWKWVKIFCYNLTSDQICN